MSAVRIWRWILRWRSHHREMLDQYDLFLSIRRIRPAIHPIIGRKNIFSVIWAESASTGGISHQQGQKTCWGFRQKMWSFCGAGVATDDGGTVPQYHIVKYEGYFRAFFWRKRCWSRETSWKICRTRSGSRVGCCRGIAERKRFSPEKASG